MLHIAIIGRHQLVPRLKGCRQQMRACDYVEKQAGEHSAVSGAIVNDVDLWACETANLQSQL
jgi:hypothetical protein